MREDGAYREAYLNLKNIGATVEYHKGRVGVTVIVGNKRFEGLFFDAVLAAFNWTYRQRRLSNSSKEAEG